MTFKLVGSASSSAGTLGILEAAVRQVFLWCEAKRGQASGSRLSCGSYSAARICGKNFVDRYVLGGAEESVFSSVVIPSCLRRRTRSQGSLTTVATCSLVGFDDRKFARRGEFATGAVVLVPGSLHISWVSSSSVRWVSSSSEIREEEEDETDSLSRSSLSSRHTTKRSDDAGSSEKTSTKMQLLSTKPTSSSSQASSATPQPDSEYHWSYTEIPRVAPIAYRKQQQFSPFGPGPPDNPWIEKPARKSALPEFNLFAASGKAKKPVKTREEILGEPLTKRGVKDLVELCDKENRQINLGRDGLTHNMLDLVHHHWRRRWVCKVTCKGVPTVDMNTVCNKLEEKTGGQIIHRKGGVVYLFRGRNYDHQTRPQIRLMLWKPPLPIYPPLIQRMPEGLSQEEADAMRKAGRDLPALRKLAKNGRYLTLVKDVRKAMKTDELVKVDCKGLNPSDMKRIGAKLKELVPCVLLSFDKECILMWRGRNLQSETDDDELDGSRKPSEVLLCDEGKEILHQALCEVSDLTLNLEEESNNLPTTDSTDSTNKSSGEQLLMGQVMSVSNMDR